MPKIFPYLIGICMFLGSIQIAIPVFYLEMLLTLYLIYLIFAGKEIVLDKNILFYFLFFILQIFSAAINGGDYLQGIKIYFFCIIIYTVIFNFLRNSSVEKIDSFFTKVSMTFLGASTLKIIYIVWENNLWNTNLIYNYKANFVLAYGSSNYIAAFFACYSIYYLWKILSSDKIKIKNFGVLLVYSIVILLLNSRTSMIIYGVFALLLLIVKIIFSKITYSKKIFTSIFFLFAMIFISRLPTFQLMLSRFENENVNLVYRFSQFSEVLEVMKNSEFLNILFGYGFGADKDGFSMLIHNVVLKLIYSTGVVSLVFYIFYIFKFINIGIKELENYTLLVLVLLVISFLEPVMYTALVEYYLAIILAVIQSMKNNFRNKMVL